MMWFLVPATLAIGLMTATAEAVPLTSLEDLPTASLALQIAAMFKDSDSVELSDVAVYQVGGEQRVVCGLVKLGNDTRGFRPFRILSSRNGLLERPQSFLVGNDNLTLRRIVFMCGTDQLPELRGQ
jgi:hypothetical protein